MYVCTHVHMFICVCMYVRMYGTDHKKVCISVIIIMIRYT